MVRVGIRADSDLKALIFSEILYETPLYNVSRFLSEFILL